VEIRPFSGCWGTLERPNFSFVWGATRDAKKDIENEEMLSRSPRGH